MMRLDPDAERVLELFRTSGRPSVTALTPSEAREVYRASCKLLGPEPPAVADVRDLVARGPGHDIPLRFYCGKDCAGGPLPAIIFMHGGGFCIGDCDTHDTICRKLANACHCAVVSVEYRLAPEHKFPAAIEDCACAVAWIEKHAAALAIDSERLAVGGDSAGGNLAAVLSHMARDGALPPICFQLLLYPSLEMGMLHPSYQTDYTRFPLNRDTVRYFHAHYLSTETDQDDWRASPLRAKSFRGLSPAFILTAGFDPLRDEASEYAGLLEKNDVPVMWLHMSDQMHGFLTMGRIIRAADTALDLAAIALRRAFRGLK
jgi:acetyl esterase